MTTPKLTLLNDEFSDAARVIRETATEYGAVNVSYRDELMQFDWLDTEDHILAELERMAEK